MLRKIIFLSALNVKMLYNMTQSEPVRKYLMFIQL